MRQFCLPFAISLILFSGVSHADARTENAQLIAKGKYLATAADCGACHTSPHQGATMAGGYAIPSPMGGIYASNITPSTTDGIGNYSEAEFARAVREGVNKQGQHLYPAMPYTAYAKISDDDIHALYFYFMHGVAPVDSPVPPTQLAFPFNIRASMAVWNLLFADNQRFTPTAGVSEQINRGDYLVNALAHCDTCHTPRNALMGQQNDRALSGGSLGSWYAPNITPDLQSGIGNWTPAELAQYLKTGHLSGKAQAAGPMAEAIEHSLQYLSDSDIAAMVAYLRQVPAVSNGDVRARESYGAVSGSEQQLRGQTGDVDAGWKVFSGSCANCHQPDGQGSERYPSLFHNTATGADRPDNLVSTILFGVQRTVHGEAIAMPEFGPNADFAMRLSDQQIADVSNYVLKNYGNPQVTVTAEQVKTLREGGETPLLVRLTRPAVMAGAGLALVLIVAGLVMIKRRRQHVAAK
ncbi:c-type cytochrome [Winslowiella iniecta]|uniref:c-type cytochrome n=1 Tax=Winslowiella iniecta TaxID=1560201 RepID=UPI0009E3C110|nr:cytochrome c [Winslowiella iniecta]